MKSRFEPAGRSLIRPVVSPVSNGPPPVKTTFVPVSDEMQPWPPPTGNKKSMEVDVTVTPPPEQLVTFSVPMGVADPTAVKTKPCKSPKKQLQYDTY